MNVTNLYSRVSDKAKSVLISALPKSMVSGLADKALSTRNRLLERSRQLAARQAGNSALEHFRSVNGKTLSRSVLEQNEPWNDVAVPDCQTPGMLTDAEKRYYQYITEFVTGEGAVVEVGTWLGMSTFYLASGLKQNSRFDGKLQCFDDYVWRASSMEKWVEGMGIETPGNFESFQPLFLDYLRKAGVEDIVESVRAKVGDYTGNENVDFMTWNGGPIEMCVVDCGRRLLVNEGWYSILSPSFVPNKTLVVMQDWQNHKAVPERFWENTRIFTESKTDSLDMVHEVRGAGIATFLYRGQA